MIQPSFSITNQMINLLVEITETITRLEIEQGYSLHVHRENQIKAIHSSLAIEKNSLTLEQVTDIIAGKRVLGAPQEIREVQNAYEAYKQVFKMNPYSIDDFLTAHKLMTNNLVKESGEFRSGDVGIYDGNGTLVHMGARPQYVYGLIDDLFKWSQIDDTLDLIKSCVVHFEIEMIHPFSDGNGRMGRLWQNLVLSQWHAIFEWIPIETMVYEHQQEYYDMLSYGDKENDSTSFIEFMLGIILETLVNFKAQGLSDKLSDKMSDKLNINEKEFFYQIYPYLQENDKIGNVKVVELTGKSPATVRRYLVKFVNLGLLGSSGHNRNHQYFLNKEKKKHNKTSKSKS